MLGKYLRSMHVPHLKNTNMSRPERMAPEFVTIPMSMGIGAPSTPVVKVGEHVNVGQLIGEANGMISAPIHASVSGKVKKIDAFQMSNGAFCQAITIENDYQNSMDESIQVPVITDFNSFIEMVRKSGAVGMGGAGFPTAAKLNVNVDEVEYILVNGAECEPYITSDTHSMIDNSERIIAGLTLMRRFYPRAKIIVGIENNKPKAIQMMKSRLSSISNLEVASLPATYPQGGEKVLIYNTTGRIVPEGGLPITVGCIVINATTISFIGKYSMTGIPLITKCVTVDGSAVRRPSNIICPIGTLMQEVVEFAGGLRAEPKKIIYGGPMMGVAVPDMSQPVLKSTNALIFMDEKEAKIPEPTACIHCGKCVDACPFDLMPTEMEHATIAKNIDTLKALKANLCMECGSCAYICPAKRNLVESHKIAKMYLREAGIK